MKSYLIYLISKLPLVGIVAKSRYSETPIRIRHLSRYLAWRFIPSKTLYWPTHHSSLVSNAENIVIGVDTSPGYMPGCYIQGSGGIVIGDYTQISCNVGLISANHDVYDISNHVNTTSPSITIGKYCWIGMNVTILPNVKIPNYCVIGAGSVVTKSVLDEGSVIVGNPAKVIKKLDVSKIVNFKNADEYIGFIPASAFRKYRHRKLKL